MHSFVKAICRKGLLTAFGKTPAQILKIINGSRASVISFDIFDTLIERLVDRPEDVFRLLQDQYESHFENRLPVAALRIAAERKAHQKSDSPEVTLSEIYNCLDVSDAERSWLQDKETADEMALCFPKESMLACFDAALKSGKRVILISDMYLPRKVIEAILQKCGISGYATLYLSSEEKKVKRDGFLFLEVLKREEIQPSDLLHIGDNARGDFLVPRKLGISATLLKTDSPCTEKSSSYAVLKRFIARKADSYPGPFVRLGYAVLGPMLYGFSKWLKSEVIRQKADRVLFLMREGALLKEAYEAVGGKDEKATLLYVSRQSTSLPLLGKDASLKQLLARLAARRVCYTVQDFCDACCLSTEERKEILSEENPQNNIRSWSSDEGARFYEKVRPILKKTAERNKNNLLLYLEHVGLGPRNLTVDVGYCGTIQSNLEQVLPDSAFFGAYLGYYLDKGKVAPGKATGFYFSHEEEPFVSDMALTSGVFELLFLDTHGTTLDYDSEGNPILAEQDNDANQTERIRQAQSAAMEFVRTFSLMDLTLNLRIAPEEWISFYSNFARRPTMRLVRALTGFEFRDSRVVPLLPNKSRCHYLLHPKELLTDFVESGCKVYFLKRLFVVPLPYHRFLVWLRNLDKKHRSRNS